MRHWHSGPKFPLGKKFSNHIKDIERSLKSLRLVKFSEFFTREAFVSSYEESDKKPGPLIELRICRRKQRSDTRVEGQCNEEYETHDESRTIDFLQNNSVLNGRIDTRPPFFFCCIVAVVASQWLTARLCIDVTASTTV
jgi:hypothetical protein